MRPLPMDGVGVLTRGRKTPQVLPVAASGQIQLVPIFQIVSAPKFVKNWSLTFAVYMQFTNLSYIALV
jgi:hypothetical protein